MTVSRFAKAIVYECLTALLLILSVVFQAAMHLEEGPESGYFRSGAFLFIAAAALTGVGVYSLMSYTLRHREHILDSVFFLITGLVLLVTVVVKIFLYGGLEAPFTESGYTAANLNLVLLAALPVPFLIRSMILALSTREKTGRRLGVQIGALVLTAALVILLAAGRSMRLLRYTEPDDADSGQQTVEYDDTM